MEIIDVDKNITLKEVGLEDVETIFNTIDSEHEYLKEWLPFVEETTDISYTHTYVESLLNSPINELVCIILYKNKFVGIVGTKDSDLGNKKTEIGYWLSENYQGNGIMTKSCTALINFLFTTLEINRIQLKAATKNYKSQRIAEKLGFKKEGIERDGELHKHEFVDLVVYGLLKNEWQKQ